MGIVDRLKDMYGRITGDDNDTTNDSVSPPVKVLNLPQLQPQQTQQPQQPQESMWEKFKPIAQQAASNVISPIFPIQKPISTIKNIAESAAAGWKDDRTQEPTTIIGKLVKGAAQIARPVVDTVTLLGKVGYNKVKDSELKAQFYMDNSDVLDQKTFFRPIVDDDKIADIAGRYDERDRVMADNNLSPDEKMDKLQRIQGEVFNVAKTFSNLKSDANIPSAYAMDKIVKNYRQLQKDRMESSSSIMGPPTEQQLATLKKDADHTTEIRDQFIPMVEGADLQGVEYRGKLFRKDDVYNIADKILNDSNIQFILKEPLKQRDMAQDLLNKSTTPGDKKYYQKKLDEANYLISQNRKYVYPYLKDVVVNLGKGGESMPEITANYSKKTGIDIEDIMGEDDLSNALLSGLPGAAFLAAKSAYKSIKEGGDRDAVLESLGDLRKDLKLNRGDVAQQNIAEMRLRSGNAGQKIMEGIGLAWSKGLENPLNTIKGWTYEIPGMSSLGRMDMESFANIDSQIAPPKGWKAQTWEMLQGRVRRAFQVGPEIAANIVPIGKASKALTILQDSRLATKLAKIGVSAERITEGMKLGDNAPALAAKIAELGPEYQKLLESGKSAPEIYKLLSKKDFFWNKMIGQPAKMVLQNYIQSAAMQTHNPNAYSAQDFTFDTIGFGIDAIVDVTKALNHYVPDNIKYKSMFDNALAKRFWDVTDDEWKMLPDADRQAFLEVTQQRMDKYNNDMKRMNPERVQTYIKNYKKKVGNAPSEYLFNKAKAADPDMVFDFETIHGKGIVPDYVDKPYFDGVLKAVDGDEKKALNIFQQLRDKDAVWQKLGLDAAARKLNAEKAIGNYVIQGTLKADTGAGKFANFFADIKNDIGDHGKAVVDGKTYSYVQTYLNETGKGGVHKTKGGIETVSKQKRDTAKYLMAEDGKEKLVFNDVDKEWEVVDAATGKPLGPVEDDARTTRLFKVRDGGKYRGTYDVAGAMNPKAIEGVVPDAAVMEAQAKNLPTPEPTVPVKLYTPEQAAKEQFMFVDTNVQLRPFKVKDAQKLHWFSNLNDAALRSNIDIKGFDAFRTTYLLDGKPLHEQLAYVARAGLELTQKELDAVKQFSLEAAAKFFPQYPELARKIEQKMLSLDVMDITRKARLEKLKEAAKVADKAGNIATVERLTKEMDALRAEENTASPVGIIGHIKSFMGGIPQVKNDISVLSRLTRDGGLGEFLKFFDLKQYEKLRDNADEFSKFFNVQFPANDWNRYKTLWRYISNDTAEAQWIKNISLVLGADVYKFGQTVMNVGGIMKLAVMNSLAFTTEEMKRYNMQNFTNDELHKLRRENNIMYSAENFRNEITSKIDNNGLFHVLNGVINGAIKVYDTGFYNFVDVFYSTSIKNQSFGQALEEIVPFIKGSDDFTQFLKTLDNDKRIELLSRISTRSDEIFNKRTGQFSEFWRSKVTVGGDGGRRSQAKAAAYWTYSLMGGRGMGMTHAAIENLTQAQLGPLIRGKFGSEYLNILQKDVADGGGKAAADLRALTYTQKNDNFLHMTEKLNFAMSMGYKLERLTADDDNKKDFLTTLREGFNMGKNFAFPLQSFESMPFGRAMLAFYEGVVSDVAADGKFNISGLDLAKGGIGTAKQIVSDMFRRFSIPKATLSAISKSISDGTANPADIFTNLVTAFQKATGGYLYYSAQEVTKNGFDLYIPLTSKSWLMEMMPYEDKFLKEYRRMSSNKQMEGVLTSRDTEGTKWLMYNAPFIKERMTGGFEPQTELEKMLNVIGQDRYFQENILHGDIVREDMSDNMKLYAYSQLTNFGSMGSDTNPQARKDNLARMTKDFDFTPEATPAQPDPKLTERTTRQNQEDIFTDPEMMKEALGDGRYDDFLRLFNESAKGNQKGAIQMIVFANAQTPGAGKEILANLVGSEWMRLLSENDGRVGGKPDPTISKQIEMYLGETYGNLMYITDKPVGRKNIGLFYAMEKHPELNAYLSTPFDKNGRPMRDIKFTYRRALDDTGEESFEDKALQNLYTMDFVSKLKTASGDTDGYKMMNAFASIWIPSGTDMKSLNFDARMCKGINNTIHTIRTSGLPAAEITNMVGGVFVGVYKKLSKYVDYIYSIPEDKLTPELRQNKADVQDNLYFLHGATQEMIQQGKEQGAQIYFKEKYGTTFKGSNAGEFKYPDYMSQQMKQLSYLFSPYRSYGTSKSYGTKYYSSKDRDYLIAYGKAKGTGVARISDFGRKQSEPAEPAGRTPVQKGGSARRFTKLADPDKLVDFTTVSTFKRKLSRKAIRYDNSGVRKSGLGGGLYNVSYQGGNRKRRVSRSKGSNSKGSAKYNKARG